MTHHHIQLIPTPTNDPKDPLRWPFGLKVAAIVVASLHNFVSNMGGSGISVAIPLLMEEFHKSQSEATQVLTVCSPLLLTLRKETRGLMGEHQYL